MEKKGSEIRSAIEELSTVIVLINKPVLPVAAVCDDDDDKKDQNSNIITNTHIPIKPFLSICNFLLQVLDKIGPTMAVLRQDIHHNIQRLEKFYETDPLVYSNVVKILKKESKESCARKNASCSRAFVWLTRALDFTVTLLQAIVKDFGLNMEQAVEESYNTTLKQWHGWISSAAYRVAMKLVPDNKTLITILTAKDEDNETLKKEIETLVSLLVPVLGEIHSILGEYGLDNMKAA